MITSQNGESRGTWKVKIEGKKNPIDYDVINGYLRKKIKSKISEPTLKYLKYLIAAIEHAISKSKVDISGLTVYKGVTDFRELEEYQFESIVNDNAFNSFSSSIDTAYSFSRKNKNGEWILFSLKLKKGDKVLYIDDLEEEWLVQKGSSYKVTRIDSFADYKSHGKTKVYYLKLV